MDEREMHARRELLRDTDTGLAMTAELITATGVWMGIGWLLDRWLGSDPWLMLSGALLGFALGTWLLFLRAQEQGRSEEADRAGG